LAAFFERRLLLKIKRRNIIMKVLDFVNAYKAKRFMVAKNGVDEKSEWLRNELEIKSYIPFKEKRKIAEMVVKQNTKEVDGVKRYDSIDGYVSLIVASIMAHTNLEWGNNPVADYDLLAESGLLPEVLVEFADSHQEIDLLLHMTLDMEMEDNEINVAVGRFLNKISGTLDGVVNVFKDKFENFDFKDILGADIKPEDLAKLSGFLDKIK
jgi:hypothetical protein